MYKRESDYRNKSLEKWYWFEGYVKEKMELHHYALHRGYTSVFKKYIMPYKGKLGEGLQLVSHYSNTYSLITYYIFKPVISESEREKFLEEVFKVYGPKIN